MEYSDLEFQSLEWQPLSSFEGSVIGWCVLKLEADFWCSVGADVFTSLSRHVLIVEGFKHKDSSFPVISLISFRKCAVTTVTASLQSRYEAVQYLNNGKRELEQSLFYLWRSWPLNLYARFSNISLWTLRKFVSSWIISRHYGDRGQ